MSIGLKNIWYGMVVVNPTLDKNQEIKEIESKLNLLKSRKCRLLQEIMEMNQ
ncbi:MAG: hypothetical protein HOD60_09860 [Candidatus Nitrosopelagicus sp.]|nr:hypothetical protein [Candidatus Nitrosopelagicus sp.]